MTTRKFGRTLLVAALTLAIVLSVTGGTIAWFTDSVESTGNKIESGTLKIELSYKNPDDIEWTVVEDGSDPLFNYDKWEPGYTTYKYVKIENKGTLALKFDLNINTSIDDEAQYNLADVIDVYVGDGTPTRDNLGTKVGTLSALMQEDDGAAHGELLAGQSIQKCLVLKMQESADNNYQDLSIGDGFALELRATQATVESDSFGMDYDANADYENKWNGNAATPDELAAVTDDEAKTIKISSPELLAAFANAVNAGNTYGNYTVSLEQDIDLNNVNWTPIGDETNFFRGIFDGQGHTISNLRCNGGAANPLDVNARYQGLFGYMYTNGNDYVCDITNLTLNNVDIYAACSAGAFVGAVDAQPGRYWFQVGQVTLKNLKLTGKVTIEGNYSGGVAGGKSDTWPGLVALVNVEVNVADGSYVSNVVAAAGSDSHAVGGVIAIAPYGVKKDITSNIDVIGNIGTVGGIAAVGGFDWENVTCTGDVTVKNATEATYQGNGTVIGKLVPQSAAPGEIVNISGTGALRIEIGDEVRTTNGQESNTIGCLAW